MRCFVNDLNYFKSLLLSHILNFSNCDCAWEEYQQLIPLTNSKVRVVLKPVCSRSLKVRCFRLERRTPVVVQQWQLQDSLGYHQRPAVRHSCAHAEQREQLPLLHPPGASMRQPSGKRLQRERPAEPLAAVRSPGALHQPAGGDGAHGDVGGSGASLQQAGQRRLSADTPQPDDAGRPRLGEHRRLACSHSRRAG